MESDELSTDSNGEHPWCLPDVRRCTLDAIQSLCCF